MRRNRLGHSAIASSIIRVGSGKIHTVSLTVFFGIIRVCVQTAKVVGPGTFSGHKRAEENSGAAAQFVQMLVVKQVRSRFTRGA
jgi:hypothetical protein